MKNCFDLCTQPLEIKLYSTSCIKMHVLWYSVVNSLPIHPYLSVTILIWLQSSNFQRHSDGVGS